MCISFLKILIVGNSLAVQWLGIGTFPVNGLGSIPDQGTKILQDMRPLPTPKKKLLTVNSELHS